MLMVMTIWRWWWYANDMTILFLQSEWGRTIPEEAYWHGRVKHPAIIKLLDCYPPSDEYFVLIMEKPANSIDLQGLIQRHGPLGEVQGRQVFSQVSLLVYIRDKKWTGAQCGFAAWTAVCWLFNDPHSVNVRRTYTLTVFTLNFISFRNEWQQPQWTTTTTKTTTMMMLIIIIIIWNIGLVQTTHFIFSRYSKRQSVAKSTGFSTATSSPLTSSWMPRIGPRPN